MENLMDEVPYRRPSERGGSMTRFEEHPPERPTRSSSRPPTVRSVTTSQSSSPERPVVPPKPLKGILKTTKKPVDTQQEEELARLQERPQEKQQDLLARRFYRLPRPDPLHYAPPFTQALPPLSPHYISDTTSYSTFDTETDSSSSVLSFNTQATSVASDDTGSSVSKRRYAHIQHIRHVPPPSVSRVRSRPPRSRPGSEVGGSSTRSVRSARSVRSGNSARSTQSKSRGRTINIQVIPANKTLSANKALPPSKEPSKELELSKKNERDLLERIEYLENEAENLRESRNRLSRDLDDASELLTVKEFGNRQIEKELNRERAEKEDLLRDLEEQRQLFDEFRHNFELQRTYLVEAEHERDSLRESRDRLETQLRQFTRTSKQNAIERKAQREELSRKLSTFEEVALTLERKVISRENEVQELLRERDALREEADHFLKDLEEVEFERDELRKESAEHLAKVEALAAEHQALQKEKGELEATLAQYQVRIEELEKQFQVRVQEFEKEKETLKSKFETADSDSQSLQQKIHGFEQEAAALQGRIRGLEEENNRLKEQLAEQLATFEPEKQALQKQLEEETRTLQQRLEDEKQAFEKQLEERTADIADKESQVHRLVLEVEGSKAANISLATEALDWKIKLASVQNELDAVHAKASQLEKSNESLGAETEQLKSRAAELEGELGAKSADIRHLEWRAADLERQSKELQDLQEQHRKLEERAAELQSAIDKAQESLKPAPPERSPPPPPIPADRESLDHSVARILARENAELEERNRELQAQADKALELEEVNRRLQAESEKAARLEAEAYRAASLERRARELQAEADKVPELSEHARALSTQLTSVTLQLQQVQAAQMGDLQVTVDHLQQVRTKSRSSSRRRPHERSSAASTTSSNTSHKRARSTGMVFVRKPSEKGSVYVTSRESLHKADRD
ncbi:hypothetical protein DL766_009445 [Monosporascus sp. MC13-8B]|uniref:Myosin tail domain-containing protein n=1 Tax=Monosporascus cannonballus TaxID=155416 RepID=A0ABY0HJZ1_9PEZI|nr:hypothetical protein DL762_000148 [Monosporascus cannonballus]RYO99321.1 hypothetical protein DL763_001600 [Monosporascus cannonballus]RYP15270.1 hypothetical protein DL766_009445 [Monosporascus sp. MC13-8B]